MKYQAEIGVFGGSGFYSFVDRVEMVAVDTPYGQPSDRIAIAELAGKRVAFLPRHGSKHSLPPHKINYRANMWAMKELGVTRIIGPCAAGSLQSDIKPGDFVICDDIVDWTDGRADTFYEGPEVVHIHMADAYCPELRQLAIRTVKSNNISYHERGTVVAINGPRFASKSESKLFSAQGWQVINMTQYPESYLARELDICYVNISLITDYDIGVQGVPESPVDKIMEVFAANNEKLRQVLFDIINLIPSERKHCACADTYRRSRIS